MENENHTTLVHRKAQAKQVGSGFALAAMRSSGGALAAILRAGRKGRVALLVSVSLAMEYEATCSEAEHQLAAGLNEREVEIFLDAVLAMAEPVKVHFLWRPQLRDPGDEMVLETAVNGQTDALVTFNVRDCKEDRTRINQLVATAVTEKLSALQTAEFFADRK